MGAIRRDRLFFGTSLSRKEKGMFPAMATAAPQVQWAYVVGGDDHQFRHITAKLFKEGINVSGHADPAREVSIPKATTFVLLMDYAGHAATDKARILAEKNELPLVWGSFTSWAITRGRLVERGIIAEQAPHGIATLADKLTPEKRAEIEARLAPSVEPAAPPPVIVTEQLEVTARPVEGVPVQENSPQEAVVPVHMQDRNSPAATKKRRELAEQLLKDHEGFILNKEINDEVTRQYGFGVSYDTLKEIRVKHNYPLPQRGTGLASRWKGAKKEKPAKEKKTSPVLSKKRFTPLPVKDSSDEVRALLETNTLYSMVSDFMRDPLHSKLELHFVLNQATGKITVEEKVLVVTTTKHEY